MNQIWPPQMIPMQQNWGSLSTSGQLVEATRYLPDVSNFGTSSGFVHSAQYVQNIVPPETAQRMMAIAQAAVADPQISGLARWLIRFLIDENDHQLASIISEIQAAYNWVTGNIRYTRDPIGVELVYDPRIMLALIKRYDRWAEDCDSQLLMLLTIMLAIGRFSRMTIAGFDPTQPHYYTHVFVEVLVPGMQGYVPPRWLIVDPSTRHRVHEMASRITSVMHFYPQL